MDPNDTLTQIRIHISESKRLADNYDGIRAWNLEQACHLMEDLDAWLSAGGYLPHAWESVSPHYSDYGYLSPSEREEQGYTRAQ